MLSTRVRAGLALLFPLVAAACGASSGPGSASGGGVLPAVCPQPAGSYIITADRTQGDCGFNAHIEKLSLVTAGPDPGCRLVDSRATPTPTGCNYEETQICPRNAFMFTAVATFSIPQNPVDFTGTATYQIEESPGHRCLATYTLRARKVGTPL